MQFRFRREHHSGFPSAFLAGDFAKKLPDLTQNR